MKRNNINKIKSSKSLSSYSVQKAYLKKLTEKYGFNSINKFLSFLDKFLKEKEKEFIEIGIKDSSEYIDLETLKKEIEETTKNEIKEKKKYVNLNVRFQVRLDDETYEYLRKLSKVCNIPASTITRFIVKMWVEKNKDTIESVVNDMVNQKKTW